MLLYKKMSSVVRGPAQRVSKSLSAGIGALLHTEAAIAAAFTQVSATNYTIATVAGLRSALPLATAATLGTNETLVDLGKTITVTALDTGAQAIFQRVQRTGLTNGVGGGAVGYVCVRNESGELNTTPFPTRQ